MNVRSITVFAHLDPTDLEFDQIAACARHAQDALNDAEYEVQTVRLALPPWPLLTDGNSDDILALAQVLDADAPAHGFDYTSVGPIICHTEKDIDLVETVPEILSVTENVFTAASFADTETGLNTGAARAIAAAIQTNASLEPNGFANLRFAALANVAPGSPFLPAAYADPNTAPALALALESGDLAVDAYERAPDLATAGERLRVRLEVEGRRLVNAVQPVCEATGVRFLGLDFSLAPFPTPEQSAAAGIESLGAAPFGAAGTLAAAALTTQALQTADYPRCGFSGLMLPVLEDATLAERAGAGSYDLNSLLMFSAVCGTGLDTVPLPGDISRDALHGILLDVGALAVRLNKPLTARLMPIPGKAAGERTDFDFPYFANSAILDVVPPAGDALLAGGQVLGTQ